MTDNKTLILQEFEQLKGQFIINDSHQIERLVAVGEDDMDYYWITYNGRQLTWHSCVGRVVPLKGYLRENDYAEFIRLAKLNHFDQVTLWGNTEPTKAKEAVDAHLTDLLTLPNDHQFLTSVCLDLN